MEERASFETRAVLAPRSARRARLELLLPAVVLVALAWAGISGPRSDPATADITDPTALAAPSLTVTPAPYPLQALGLPVRILDDVLPGQLGPDDVIAVAGWYVAQAITECPPLAAIYRDGSLPYVRGDADALAFCKRSGVLYASRPDFEGDGSGDAGLPAIAANLAVGIIASPEIEIIGTEARQVVVLGRFIESSAGCLRPAGCRELMIDHVAWIPGV